MKLCKVKNFQVSRSNGWSILKTFHMLLCIRSYHIWKAPVILSPLNCKALPDFRNYFVSLFPLALNSKPDKKEHLFVWRYSYPFRLSSTLSSPYPRSSCYSFHAHSKLNLYFLQQSTPGPGFPMQTAPLHQEQTHH